MADQGEEQRQNGSNVIPFLAGVLVGGLAGAATMLLLAPQSGQQTRSQLQRTGIELRDQALDTVDDTVAQVRRAAQQITDDVREKAEELQRRSQEMLDEQRERLSTVLERGNKDIKMPA